MVALAFYIFFARILDVSLGTVRTILLVKGRKLPASIVAFIEISIWFLIVREALSADIDNYWIILAYAAGFASGTYLGSILSDKYIKGTFNVQVICMKNDQLVDFIREKGFGVTAVDVRGREKGLEKMMLFIEINKHDFESLKKIIKSIDEKAFIIVHESKFVQNGYFQKKV